MIAFNKWEMEFARGCLDAVNPWVFAPPPPTPLGFLSPASLFLDFPGPASCLGKQLPRGWEKRGKSQGKALWSWLCILGSCAGELGPSGHGGNLGIELLAG